MVREDAAAVSGVVVSTALAEAQRGEHEAPERGAEQHALVTPHDCQEATEPPGDERAVPWPLVGVDLAVSSVPVLWPHPAS